MIELEYEMTYRETIEGPLAPTTGSPLGERLCWQVTTGTLKGERVNASLAMPGTDWMRPGPDGLRRQDLRVQLVTDDGATILFHYDTGMIRPSEAFLRALQDGGSTDWSDQYMRMVPEFEVAAGPYSWLSENLFVAEGRIADTRTIEYRIYRVL